MTDKEVMQQALEALESGLAFDTHSVVLQNLRTALAMHQVSEFAQAQEQAEPVAREGFNTWWDGDYDDSANPFEQDSAAYWAWAGWQAAQRAWVGLTDEDFLEACQIAERGNYLLALQRIQIKLKERNT